MNRTFSYVLLSFLVFCVLLISNLVHTDHGISTVIDDSIGFVIVVSGFFIFRKSVHKSIQALDQKITWKKNPIERFLREFLAVAKWSFSLAAVLLILLVLLFHFYGPPAFIKRLDEKHHAQLFLHRSMDHGPSPFRDSLQHLRAPGVGQPTPLPHPPKHPPKPIYRDSALFFIEEIFGVSALLFIILFGTEEISALNQRIQYEALEEERRVKNEAVSKFAALQQQLNPHFMFNTLNVLTGLVHEDANKAEEYIKKLSDVYRYVLTQSNQATVTVEKELDFIIDYIFLQKIRFNENLQIRIQVEDKYLAYLIPSLAIEILVENAIKHNIIKASSPLKISITVKDEMLEVANNIQKRLDDVDSTAIGLSNLVERMKLLSLPPPISKTSDQLYRTRLPMLPPEV